MKNLVAGIALVLGLTFGCGAQAAHHHHTTAHHRVHVYDAGSVVGGSPAGCPRIAFCGCGTAKYLLGEARRDLWLAANWLRFPRSVAGPGKAAVFGLHHVVAIIDANGDGTAKVYDPNSGGHLTRIHTVSLAGATIVDPHGGGGYASRSRGREAVARREQYGQSFAYNDVPTFYDRGDVH